MVMGRPQEWDREYIMQEMLAWAKLPDSLNINAFCTSLDPEIDPDYLLRLSKETEDFRRVYRIVKAYLATRREEANSEKMLSDKAFSSGLRNYDLFLKEDWKEEKTFESSLRKDEEGNKYTNVVIKVQNDGLGAGLNVSTEDVSAPSNKST